MKTNLFYCTILVFVLSLTALSQQSSGTIDGRINMETVQTEKNGIIIKLVEVNLQSLVQTSAVTNEGTFVFRNVPFATYDIMVENARELFAVKRIVVNSIVPVQVVIYSIKQFQSAPVYVIGSVTSFDESKAASHSVYTEQIINQMPSSASSKKIENIILSTPGAVPDEDGRMHLRGEDAQLQYIIDGIPVTGNLTRETL